MRRRTSPELDRHSGARSAGSAWPPPRGRRRWRQTGTPSFVTPDESVDEHGHADQGRYETPGREVDFAHDKPVDHEQAVVGGEADEADTAPQKEATRSTAIAAQQQE